MSQPPMERPGKGRVASDDDFDVRAKAQGRLRRRIVRPNLLCTAPSVSASQQRPLRQNPMGRGRRLLIATKIKPLSQNPGHRKGTRRIGGDQSTQASNSGW